MLLIRRGKGAIEWTSLRSTSSSARYLMHFAAAKCTSSTAGSLQGQGATEYLVLLAVVLVIALVGIALLGFFPGTASDAQIAESQIYWESATPIAITEWAAMAYTSDPTRSIPYLRIRNTGTYPIRLTQILGNGQNLLAMWCDAPLCATSGVNNISTYFYLAPGEESWFGGPWFGGGLTQRYYEIGLLGAGTTGSYRMYAASSICRNGTSDNGVFTVPSFGFEYI